MPFKGADRCFGLRLGNRNVEKRVVGGVEPYSCISIEHPMAPALRIAEFWLEGPAVNAPVNELRGIILTGRRDYLQTDAQQHLLVPFHVRLRGHCWTALEIHGEPGREIQQ